MKLRAKKIGKGGRNIVISKESFEHILACLANQKFVNEAPPNGDAMAMGKKAYNKVQKEIQSAIDDCYRQMEKILYK